MKLVNFYVGHDSQKQQVQADDLPIQNSSNVAQTHEGNERTTSTQKGRMKEHAYSNSRTMSPTRKLKAQVRGNYTPSARLSIWTKQESQM
eukprot:2262009-Amphidinium_carterae.1